MTTGQRVVQICLFLFTAIALFGGALQMSLGEPETAPRLDNIHRFLAGIYMGAGFICGWCAWTIQRQRTLVYLIALTGFLGGMGRIVSMTIVGLPEPASLWLSYVGTEIIVPIIIVIAQWMTDGRGKG